MFGTSDIGKTPAALAVLCLGLLAGHAVLASVNRGIHGDPPVMSAPPGELSRKAFAFGDDQFLYRRFAISLQNAGDGGGQVTPIGKYNYDHVLGWLRTLAALDPKAQHHFILATRYFSFTQNGTDLRRVIGFIVERASLDPPRHWYWLTQCIELADHRLKDPAYALQIAEVVATYDFPDVPHWVWMFPALLLEKLGRHDEAYARLQTVRAAKAARLTREEMNWLEDISHRLKTGRE